MPTTIYLVRHAQARPLPHQAEPDWALSERGQQQALALVPVLTALGVVRAYSSPFLRCRQTLQPFADAAGIPLSIHEGLRERLLTGRWIDDFREIWSRSWADLAFALEDGESGLACRERMAAAVAEIIARHPGETITMASHGYAIGLLLTTVDPNAGIREASALRTPELLRIVHDGTALRWDRSFRPGADFDQLATDFRLTPESSRRFSRRENLRRQPPEELAAPRPRPAVAGSAQDVWPPFLLTRGDTQSGP